MSVYRIVLPWSKPPLSLNDSPGTTVGAMRARAKTIRDTRATASILARQARLPKSVAHVEVALHYRPRDRRHRDPINLCATQKALVDGLRDYGLVPDDDPRFVTDLMPTIHYPIKGKRGALWLYLAITSAVPPAQLDRTLPKTLPGTTDTTPPKSGPQIGKETDQ